MKIAVYIDEHDELISLYERGRFLIYQGSGTEWAMVQEIAFSVDDSISLVAVKAALSSAIAQFGGCDMLLSGGVKGFLYAFLQEEFGLRIWRSEGSLLEQLAAVEQRERDRAERERLAPKSCAVAAVCASGGCGGGRGHLRGATALNAPPPESALAAAEDLGGGALRIDLVAALARDSRLNSRQILLPILEGTAFDRLEILCEHLPKWFAPKLQELNLKADCVPLETGHGVKAIVSHDVCCG